jgi:hypothetical protein
VLLWQINIILLISVDSELFGDENGAEPDRQTASSSDLDNFLAMVKDQWGDHHAQKTAAEQVPGEETVAEQAPSEETVAEQAQGEDSGRYLISCTVDDDIHRFRPLGRCGTLRSTSG